MRKFQIAFQGNATPIEANTKEEAWKAIKDYLHCYTFYTIKEIGVEVDEHGYPLKKG